MDPTSRRPLPSPGRAGAMALCDACNAKAKYSELADV